MVKFSYLDPLSHIIPLWVILCIMNIFLLRAFIAPCSYIKWNQWTYPNSQQGVMKNVQLYFGYIYKYCTDYMFVIEV